MKFVLFFVVCLVGFFICFFAGHTLKNRWRDALIEWGNRELDRQRMFFREQLEKTLEMYGDFYQNYKKTVDEQRAKDRAVFEKSLAEISEMYDAQCRRCFNRHKNEQRSERDEADHHEGQAGRVRDDGAVSGRGRQGNEESRI